VISGVRFYKGSTNTGTHMGHLWSRTWTLLATATFSNETATGWQQVLFSAPVTVTAGTTYVVSYWAPVGHYSVDNNYFATTGRTNAPLTALAAGVDGVNGVYRQGSSAFPTSSYLSSNYWVDVVFTPTAPPMPTGLSVGTVASSSVPLSWTDGPSETSYRVQRSVDVDTPGGPMVHDMAFTEKYALLFDLPVTYAGGGRATLWNHLKLAFAHQESLRGPHGGYLAEDTGDWSDFSTAFLQMTESTLVSAQAAYIYPRLAMLADVRGDHAFAAVVRRAAARDLKTTRAQWTGGGWYSRGYAGGREIGTGAIFGEPQPWAILAGAPSRSQAGTLVGRV